MLRFSKYLLFPALKFQNTTSFKINFKNQDAQIRIYKLDWASIDKIKEERWAELQYCSPPANLFPGTLPTCLKDINDQLYAIPETFLEEIRLYSLKATEEYGSKGLDVFKPNTIPVPLTPAVSFILNAFNILADCAYDPSTNYFSRSNHKYILAYILAYKFWAFQVTPDLLERYSGLRELSLELQGLEQIAPAIYKDLALYYQSLIEHTKELIKKQAKEIIKVVAEASLEDFVTNKRASASLNNVILKIPEVGEIQFTKITFTRRGGITLSGELDQNSVDIVLRAYSMGQFPRSFTTTVSDGIQEYLFHGGCVEGLSGNPPPIIKMKFGQIQKKPTANLDDLNNVIYPANTVKQISSERIKKGTEEALQENEKFKEINIQTKNHSSILRGTN